MLQNEIDMKIKIFSTLPFIMWNIIRLNRPGSTPTPNASPSQSILKKKAMFIYDGTGIVVQHPAVERSASTALPHK